MQSKKNDNNGNNEQKQKLGDLVDHFPVKNQKIKRWFTGGLGVLTMIASILLLAIQLVIIWSAVRTHGRAIILSKLPMPLAICTIIFLIGVLLIIRLPIHWSDGITLYKNAMIMRSGIKKRLWLWQETKRLDTRLVDIKFASTTIATKLRIVLESEGNQRLVIRNRYHNMEALNNHIRTNILPILYQKEMQRLSQGGSISFHKNLVVFQNSLKINNNMLAWRQIEKIEVDKRYLKIYTKSNPNKPQFSTNVNKITNLDLLHYFAKNQSLVHA